MNDNDTHAKLSYLRQDAADALHAYLSATSRHSTVNANQAALGYIIAQTRYTLACLEAKQGDVLPNVEVPASQQGIIQ